MASARRKAYRTKAAQDYPVRSEGFSLGQLTVTPDEGDFSVEIDDDDPPAVVCGGVERDVQSVLDNEQKVKKC